MCKCDSDYPCRDEIATSFSWMNKLRSRRHLWPLINCAKERLLKVWYFYYTSADINIQIIDQKVITYKTSKHRTVKEWWSLFRTMKEFNKLDETRWSPEVISIQRRFNKQKPDTYFHLSAQKRWANVLVCNIWEDRRPVSRQNVSQCVGPFLDRVSVKTHCNM